MNYFTEVKIKVKILLHFLSYYAQFALVPLIFILRFLGGIIDAYYDAVDTCKQAYREHRMCYRGF